MTVTRPPKTRRMSRPSGDLPDAIRAVLAWRWDQACLSARTRIKLHPDLFFGTNVADPWDHIHPLDRRLFDAASKAGLWTEPEASPYVPEFGA